MNFDPLVKTAKAAAELIPLLVDNHIHKCCINCENFIGSRIQNIQVFICDKAKQTPPPEIIMRGCELHEFTIPF